MYVKYPVYGDETLTQIFHKISERNHHQDELYKNITSQIDSLIDAIQTQNSAIVALDDRITALESNAPTPPSPQS